ncbi:MAG TPA: orotidine-5'-phosphate decarboxylase [Myxococcota bacterium]|jgi:orotidine-5'-phosphate decarboxylase|nr:orotidine-5'-phosphate decarboxylase [Myxococcota bacterium]
MVDDGDARKARDRLAVGLDVPDLTRARALLAQLGDAAGWLKVGLELYTAAGPEAIRVAAERARVFLDVKLHDIPHTVAGAAAAATRHGVSLLTVHASGGADMLRAAREGAEEAAAKLGRPRPRMVAVTVLTSLAEKDLASVGVRGTLDDQVARLVDLARSSGIDGVVASPLEAAAIRARCGPDFFVVTPGIRPAGASRDDQSRVATPAEAIAAGADLLVVVRPVLRAPDPAAAVRGIVAEIERGLGSRAA